jgi:hypothetical protein
VNDAGGTLVVLLFLVAYFGPTLTAFLRKKRNVLAIFVLNFLTGWTVVGWFAAFIWALTVDAPTPGVPGAGRNV